MNSLSNQHTNTSERAAAAMHIWNEIRAWFQERIQAMGVDETSFPMFLSSKSLEKVSTSYNGHGFIGVVGLPR